MPRRELSKCRKWERERRDRLNSSFKSLSQILPSYDPCVKLSKGEILQRAKYYIEELQNKNRQLQLGDVKETDNRNEIQVLEGRIEKLLIRVEQLAKLLRDAGITVPSDLDTTTKFCRPKVWTNKITHEQTEIIAERIRNLKNGEKLIVQKSSISVKKREKLQNNKVKARKILTNSKLQNHNVKNDERQKSNKQKAEKSNQPTTSNHTNCTTSLPLTNSNAVNKTKKSVQNCTSIAQTSVMTGNMNFSSRTSLVKTSSLLSAPIMATGINNHSSLSSLGPGTLILANGNTIQIQPAIISTVVSPPPNPTLLVIDNNPKLQTPLNKNHPPPLIFNNKLGTSNSSKNVLFEFPKIVPKLDSTKTTTVNKIPIPIPALSSNVQKIVKNINNKSKRIVKKASNKIKSKENRKISLLKIKTIRLQNKKSKNILTSSPAKIRKIEKVCDKTETPDASESEANSNNLKSTRVDTIKIVENKTEVEDTQKKSSTNSYSVDSLCNSTSIENKNLQKENQETNSTNENEQIQPKIEDGKLQIITSNEVPPPTDKKEQIEPKEQIEENNTNKNVKNVESCKHQENKKNKEIDSLKTNEMKQLNPEKKGELTSKSNTIEAKATCNVTKKESEIIPEKATTASTSNSKSVIVDSTPISISNSVSLEPVKSTDISLSLNLPNTDFSNDIFASLHVPHGSQPELISPTAAFLLAFPLVSTLPGGKIPENVDDETSDSQQGTPTLLQIGNIEGGNNKQSDTSTSQLLDNIPNLFANKEFSQNENNINKSSRHSLKKQPESKCMDFIQNDCTENKCKTSKETTNPTKSTTKEKVTSTSSFDLLNTTNCLFSEIPLFPNSSVPNNIFNYEHIPVTYSMPKLPEMFPLCNTNNPKENDGTIFKKDVKPKNDVILSLPNLTFTPSEFLPASSNNYSLEKLSHSNIISSSGSNNTTSINNNNITTVQTTSMSVSNSQQDNTSSEYNDKINNFNKKQNLEYNVTKRTNDICKLNQNWKNNSNNESLCQNVFNVSYSTSTGGFKQPSTRSNNEKLNEKSYSHLSTSNAFDKVNYSNIIDKNVDKNTSQKPPVNWMTTPDSRSKLDNALTSDVKREVTKNYQNISYSKSSFSIDNTEKVFNTEPYYQNIDPINFNVDKKPVVNHNFTPIFSSSNYSVRSQNNNNNNNSQYSWPSSTKLSTLNDNLHLGLQTPSTLPMLVGDLALNTTSNQGKYENKDFECDKKVLASKEHFATKNIDKYKSKHCPETQTNNSFFSVSQLVEHNKHDQTAVRPQTNNQRKSIPQNRSTKVNSIQRQSKRSSKPNDEITSKSHSNTNENFSCAKTSTQCSTENKQLIFQDLPTFSLPQLELYENSNVSRDIDWAKPTQETSFMNKNTYKNCSSTYSAEALIGHNIQNNNSFQKGTVYSTNTQQYMPSTPKRMQMGPAQPYETIGAPFYTTPVPETTFVTNYYSQSSNTFTYTTSNTLYQPSSLMTSSSNFINTSSLIPDIETDFTNSQTLNVSESTSNNLDISSSNRQTHCSKSKTDGRTTSNTLQNKNQSSTYSNHTKRSVMKRKQSTAEPLNNLPGFSDLGFLSLSSMNSPMLSDDPFHSHTNYFSANTSQMYTGSSQNSMYTKRINQQNHEYSSCNLLPSLPSAPFTRSNILPHTQNAVASPSNSGGNALTNFNLSTIFPEINKPFASGLYDNSALRSGNNLSTTSSQQTYTDYTNVQ